MFQIVNGIIIGQPLVEEIIKKGFECLGDVSPFNGKKTPVFTSRLGTDSNLWRVYLYEDNSDHINDLGNGVFEVNEMESKSFVSLISSDGFLQIDPGIKGFNHLEAIRVFINYGN